MKTGVASTGGRGPGTPAMEDELETRSEPEDDVRDGMQLE
jgi:hypothetical protein